MELNKEEKMRIVISGYEFNRIKEMVRKMDSQDLVNNPILRSVNLELKDNKLKAIVCDGYCMNIRDIELYGDTESQDDGSWLIPFEFIKRIPSAKKKNIYNYVISVADGWVTITHKDNSFGCKLCIGKYPDYLAVLPKEENLLVATDKIALNIQVIQRILIKGDYAHKLYFYGQTKPIVIKNMGEELIGILMPVYIREWTNDNV